MPNVIYLPRRVGVAAQQLYAQLRGLVDRASAALIADCLEAGNDKLLTDVLELARAVEDWDTVALLTEEVEWAAGHRMRESTEAGGLPWIEELYAIPLLIVSEEGLPYDHRFLAAPAARQALAESFTAHGLAGAGHVTQVGTYLHHPTELSQLSYSQVYRLGGALHSAHGRTGWPEGLGRERAHLRYLLLSVRYQAAWEASPPFCPDSALPTREAAGAYQMRMRAWASAAPALLRQVLGLPPDDVVITLPPQPFFEALRSGAETFASLQIPLELMTRQLDTRALPQRAWN